ncbi:1123_t:CDS:2 [Rhizophagus irregularis]|nr:1123_t:CDS:2 [Rhizophagus irregularis]
MSSNKKTSRTLKWKNILRKNPQDYLNEKEKISKIDLRKENIRNKLNVKSNLHGPLKIENFTKLKSIYLEKLKLTDLEIINCPQLTKIDLSELSKLKSLFVSNCSRLTKLDISHSQLIELTDLDVSNLIELNCSNTSIKRLSLNLCPNIIKLICSNNNKLDNLDISNCLKLGYLDCSNNSKLTSLDISSCPKDIELIKPTDLKVIEKEEKIVKIKNILIIGCTGSGKSTLASVLTETEGFKESEYGVSKTKHFKKGVFEWKGTKYRVIDTTGVGSTGLSTKKVSNRIAEGIFSVPLSEGINQVLLVVGKNFTDEINTLRLFESDIFKCTTIVRTKFSNFKNQDICEKDKEKLCEESEINAKIIKSCKDHLEKVCQEEVLHMEYDASTNATGAIQPPNSDTEITDDDNTYVDYSTDDENTRPDHFTSLPSLPQPITINHRELQPYHITKIAIKGLKFIESDQQVIEHLKLNHGLLLDGQPSKQAIFVKNGELSISLYNGQPIVYTEINKSTELCINFPIAEVAYKGD